MSSTNSDSNFEVRIEQRMFRKGHEAVVKQEYYNEWADADAAYCAYRDLTNIKGSSILHVELIEHRKRVIHKASTKSSQLDSVGEAQ